MGEPAWKLGARCRRGGLALVARATVALHGLSRGLFKAASQWQGFHDRLGIDGVLVIHLFPMDCARAVT